MGIVLDLKSDEGYEILLKLVRSADVLVHNFRPDVAPRLRIDFETLEKINPRLIYCSLTGYGGTGPLKNKAGYDQVLQTMTGICSMQGSADKPEIVYGSVVDYYAASLLAGGVTSALFARERTGKAQYVGISLLRSAMTMQSARLVWAENEPREVNRDMRSGGVTGLHPTREGTLYISANTPHFWAALCELTGLQALLENPRYDTVRKRAEHADEIIPQLHAALGKHTAHEWEELFGERVPCAVALQIEDMFDHPQVQAENMIKTYQHPLVGSYRGMAQPIQFGTEPQASTASAAPTFGQHTDLVLSRIGYSAEQTAGLKKAGVVS